MGQLFSSLTTRTEDDNKLDQQIQGSLFHSIEYELSGIVNKINNIDSLDPKEIYDIIQRQHHMILNYDLFLMSPDTRAQAQTLFTSKKFLQCFLSVIRLLDITHDEKICINKLAYDYYILPDKDSEISDMLYQLTTEVNGKEVIVLSGIIGITKARILSMIRNSSFKEEKCIHRVNTYIIKCCSDNISLQNVINIYGFLFKRFGTLFTTTMLEAKPENLTLNESIAFDLISTAMLEILNSLTSNDIKKVLADYVYTISMVKSNITVRFSIKTADKHRYSRILNIIKDMNIVDNLIVP